LVVFCFVHTTSAVTVHALAGNQPHEEHAVQLVAPVDELKFDPAVHALHMLVFGCELKLPAAQGVHARSVVAVGLPLTEVPAPQTLSGTHERSLPLAPGTAYWSAVHAAND